MIVVNGVKILTDDMSRFWSKVSVREADECWPWLAGTFRKGYGQFGISEHKKYKKVSANKLALILATGENRTPLLSMHSCDNPECCNPRHLSWGTHKQNTKDGLDKGRIDPRKTAKITKEDAIEIRQLRSSGMGMRQIGEKFSVTISNISAVCRGISWKE